MSIQEQLKPETAAVKDKALQRCNLSVIEAESRDR